MAGATHQVYHHHLHHNHCHHQASPPPPRRTRRSLQLSGRNARSRGWRGRGWPVHVGRRPGPGVCRPSDQHCLPSEPSHEGKGQRVVSKVDLGQKNMTMKRQIGAAPPQPVRWPRPAVRASIPAPFIPVAPIPLFAFRRHDARVVVVASWRPRGRASEGRGRGAGVEKAGRPPTCIHPERALDTSETPRPRFGQPPPSRPAVDSRQGNE